MITTIITTTRLKLQLEINKNIMEVFRNRNRILLMYTCLFVGADPLVLFQVSKSFMEIRDYIIEYCIMTYSFISFGFAGNLI